MRVAKEVRIDAKDAGVSGDILPSGEWPENFSLLNYEDLTKHYEPDLFKPEVCMCSACSDLSSYGLCVERTGEGDLISLVILFQITLN